MSLKKYKLEELIRQSDTRNVNSFLLVNSVKGISTGKEFIDTKANMDGVSLTSYKIVENGQFAYVADTSRRGDKIGLAYNSSKNTLLISSIYTVFYIYKKELLIPEYLFMYFNRPEFDRYSRYNSWGSARETFTWEEMCDIEIELPPVEIQQKYVDIYNAMVENQKSYERGLDDLKLTCDAYIENLKTNTKNESIGKYIEQVKNKNIDDAIKEVYGVSNTLQFVTASSSVDKENLTNYKIVEKQDIAYVPTTHMKIWAVAVSDKENPIVVSPIYEVFRVKNKNILNPEFLFLWLCREETIRYAYYNSWGSARENFNFEDMCTVSLPIPDIKIQEAIVEIFKSYRIRKRINEYLKQQIKTICPILIKGSIEEGKKE